MGNDFWVKVDKVRLPVVCPGCGGTEGYRTICAYDEELGFDKHRTCNCCAKCRRACYENV